MKENLGGVIISIIVIVTAIIGGNMYYKNKENIGNVINNNEKNTVENYEILEDYKTAIIYFSATGTTEKIAQMIGEEVGANLIEIEPEIPYTSADLNYNSDCRANREQNDDNARPKIKNTINVEDYDVIYLGYPIWWGTNPKIILTFLDSYNLEGKTIIPFCTSGSTGISSSISDLKNYNSKLNILDGKRFGSSTTKSDIKNWVETLNIEEVVQEI